jgi:hypothetical protein
MTFIDAVNRILRINGFIRGDTDILSAFTDTNHNATSNICQIAIQSEIAELSIFANLAMERANATLSLATGTRTYALNSAFVRLWGDPPFFLDTTQNYRIFEYPGGEDQLRDDIIDYKTQSGAPNYFYFEQTSVKTVAFFPVPDASVNGRSIFYDYEKSVTPVNSTDTLPFQRDDESFAFCEAAGRRFKYLYEGKNDIPVTKDPVYQEAMAKLLQLMRGKNPSRRYGKDYV